MSVGYTHEARRARFCLSRQCMGAGSVSVLPWVSWRSPGLRMHGFAYGAGSAACAASMAVAGPAVCAQARPSAETAQTPVRDARLGAGRFRPQGGGRGWIAASGLGLNEAGRVRAHGPRREGDDTALTVQSRGWRDPRVRQGPRVVSKTPSLRALTRGPQTCAAQTQGQARQTFGESTCLIAS